MLSFHNKIINGDSLEELNYNLIKYLDACTHPVIDNMQDDFNKAKEIFKK